MVDRASLITTLERCITPTGTQAEAIRKALDKALHEAVLALPLAAATELPSAVRSELEIVLTSLDQKLAEKLAAAWEPKRKLDPDMKRSVKKDLLDLLHCRRPAYEPINFALEEARSASAAPLRIVIERVAPAKDLKALLSKWDKSYKPTSSNRSGLTDRLLALLNGATPTPRPAPKAAKRESRSTA